MRLILQKPLDPSDGSPNILYESLEIAEEYTGLRADEIQACLEGSVPSAGEYTWSWCTRTTLD